MSSTSYQYYIYILTDAKHNTLYTGVTNDLKRRVYEHKHPEKSSFTEKYHVNMLMYYEIFDTMDAAIRREKQIKGGSRAKKIALIESMNKEWKDLYEEIVTF
ncbi:MAG TPA: GIY-YIG nuclease family protein [Candidatus Kapabacteria bacterium]|nr:GIY-YIG nuclease family protein [Candidatus Kapabacteria bacterium]